jgi:multidrug efflux system membrane fusion protein
VEEEGRARERDPRKPRRRRRWWVWFLVAVILSGAGYWLFRRAFNTQGPAAKPAGRSSPQNIPVKVAAARRGAVSVYLNGLGSVAAYNTVTVKSRVDGQLIRIAFKEGQFVQAGDLLADLDPRPFEVQLAQAEGQLARDQAQLNNAKVDLARYQTLLEQDSIPRQQLDTQIATVAQFEGAIKADQAQIESARLQLTYCHISAPIGGRVGLRLVDVGNIVHANDQNGALVITQVQPISVLFTIPEDDLPPVLKKLRAGTRLPVEAYDRSGKAKIATGYLLTLDNQIDPSTGTARLKAVFQNRDNALFPNQFVNVRLLLDVRRESLLVPVVAIQRGPQGTFVYVVKANHAVEVRPVTLGITEGNDASIDAGLSAGEVVVVDGMDKLQAGSQVRLLEQDSGQQPSGQRPKA